jgi:hypothetical protein
MASPTLTALRARLSPRSARAAAARDATQRAARIAALAVKASAPRTKSALCYRQRNLEKARAAERANYAANPARPRANAKRYRAGHPEVEAAGNARFCAAKKARVIAERERKAQVREYNTAYQSKRRARLATELCQASP